MIKTIAFDLVGVLVGENNIELTPNEDKLERLFGPNISDIEYLEKAREKTYLKDDEIIELEKKIINKLYKIRDIDLFKKVRMSFPDIKIVIATNHVTYIREYLENNFDADEIVISAEINKIKPNIDFYIEVSKLCDTNIEEILFVDDNMDNVEGAIKSGMKAIKIDRYDDVYQKIINNA